MHRAIPLPAQIEMLVPPLPWDRPKWRPNNGPTVVLLHGLWRGYHAMEPLARLFHREGFATLNLPYPSFRLPIPALVERIRREVETIAGDPPVHFVTHSLGGIIARSLLTDSPPWTPGRLVMLAPPNGGSEIVDWSQHHRLFQFLLGPAGRSLGTNGFPTRLPPLAPGIESAAIMGTRCSIPYFKHLLETTNDGIVSTNRGSMPGLHGFAKIEADHTFIQAHPEAIRLCLGFLRTGIWDAPPASSSPDATG
jgi:triacylglycerol lipase